MQMVFPTFSCSYTYMQLNLKYNFFWKFLYLCKYIIYYVLSKLLNNLLKFVESHESIKMFEIYLKINFWNIRINVLQLN